MTTQWVFILACLACWRICHFVAKEDGPLGFMFDIRYRLLRCTTPNLGLLIRCVKCLSVWTSLIFTLVLFWKLWFLYWLAMSAVVMLFEALYDLLWQKSNE
jgi:hypothetical protein